MYRALGQSEKIATGQVLVGTGSTLIVPARKSRQRLKISFNNVLQNLYLGDLNVTTSNGYLVHAATAGLIEIDVDTADAVYMTCASGSPTVYFIEHYD